MDRAEHAVRARLPDDIVDALAQPQALLFFGQRLLQLALPQQRQRQLVLQDRLAQQAAAALLQAQRPRVEDRRLAAEPSTR